MEDFTFVFSTYSPKILILKNLFLIFLQEKGYDHISSFKESIMYPMLSSNSPGSSFQLIFREDKKNKFLFNPRAYWARYKLLKLPKGVL